jgi:hypothetical protein
MKHETMVITNTACSLVVNAFQEDGVRIARTIHIAMT